MPSGQIAKYKMELDWKEFNLSLPAVEIWMRANAGEQYCGNQAHGKLEIWFVEEPSEEIKSAVSDYWDGLSESSNEAVAYESLDDIESEKEVKKASGKAKLAALGLTEDEISALLG